MALSGSFTTNTYMSTSYTLSWSASQSIANNQSTITWWLDCNRASNQGYIAERTLVVTLGGHTLVNKSDRVERYGGRVTSGSFTITHDSNGAASMSGSLSAALYYSSVNTTGSGSWNLDTIARQAKLTGAPDMTDEDNPKITYSNPAGNNVTTLMACISLTGAKDDVPYRAINKTGTLEYTFNLTDEERQTLINSCTTAKSRTIKFYVRTVIGGNTFYSILDKTLTIVNAEPVITNASAEDIKNTVDLTGDNQKIIKGFNTIAANVAATALKGATITSYSIKNGSTTLTTNSGSFENSESGVVEFTVTDSRGYIATQTVNLTVIDYIKLTCDLEANAPNAEGDMHFKISGNCWAGDFGAVTNGVALYYRYKVNDESYGDWISITPAVDKNSNTYSIDVNLTGLNYRNAYTFQAQAQDSLITIASAEKKVQTIPIFDWGASDFNFNVPVTIQGGRLLAPYLLFEGDSSDTVTLSDSITNYNYIEVVFVDNTGKNGGYTKFKGVSDSTNLCLSIIEASNGKNTYIRRTLYTASGNTLTPNIATSGYVLFSGTSGNTVSANIGSNYIRVLEVIGYR